MNVMPSCKRARRSFFPAPAGDDLLFGFAFREQLGIPAMQAVLGFPGYRLDVLALLALTRHQRGAESRAVPIRPSRLDDDPAQMRVAGCQRPHLMRFLTSEPGPAIDVAIRL